MNWQTVESSQIAEIGYEEESQTLGIKFRPFKGDGPLTEYAYSNVPFRVHRALLAAKDDPKSSIGKYFDLNIKKHPDLYPYEKIGVVSANGTGEVVDSPGSALAKIDKMTAEQIFVANALDSVLETIREEALTEAKKYDISTPEKRKGLKSLAFKLVKSRTYIEGLAKAHTIETKRKLALIDSEKRRVCDILQGIEDEVRSPLTAWENKEKARVQKHEDALTAIREMQPHVYPDIPSLTEAIRQLEGMDTDTFEEFSAPAERARQEVLETLLGELETRQRRETERVELERLRAESAQRAEQDRIANAAKEAREQAEREAKEREEKAAIEAEAKIQTAVEAAKEQTRQEVRAELIANPSMAIYVETPSGPGAHDDKMLAAASASRSTAWVPTVAERTPEIMKIDAKEYGTLVHWAKVQIKSLGICPDCQAEFDARHVKGCALGRAIDTWDSLNMQY